MKHEDKQLLLKDLCARLPYGVIVNIPHDYYDASKAYIKAINPEREIIYYEICGSSSPLFDRNILGIKPYLRQRMTEEEIIEFYENYKYCTPGEKVDWYNAHHLDYRGLIPKGLAIEAPKGMYD